MKYAAGNREKDLDREEKDGPNMKSRSLSLTSSGPPASTASSPPNFPSAHSAPPSLSILLSRNTPSLIHLRAFSHAVPTAWNALILE